MEEKTIDELLNEEIADEIKALSELEAGSNEKSAAIEDLTKLYKLRIEENKSSWDADDKTLNMYVNDAIGYKMTPEQVLYYSENCFGTADAISFRNGLLRIHDLKTGEIPAHMEQLEIYAALFCLEYNVKPGDIEMELRLYQSDEILYHNPTAMDILPIMDKIITFDKVINKIKDSEG